MELLSLGRILFQAGKDTSPDVNFTVVFSYPQQNAYGLLFIIQNTNKSAPKLVHYI